MGAPSLDYSEFAANPYGVLVKPLDYNHADAPTSKTYHGITIEANGKVLGRIQSWNVAGAYTRAGEHVYELNNRTWGRPVDYVPGRSEGYNITATVAELWNREIEVQLGLVAPRSQMVDLIDQTAPFTCREFWFRGNDIYRVWTYRGCWFTNRNEENYTSDGNARVISAFEFNYVARQLVSGVA
jgi:hypothetical protein